MNEQVANEGVELCPGCHEPCRKWGHGEKEKSYPNGCFTCQFWVEKMDPDCRDSPLTVRISGRHYRIGPERAEGFRGYGGARFVIQFHDGRKAVTTNLWSQGEIPEAFWALLPNNATFVKE